METQAVEDDLEAALDAVRSVLADLGVPAADVTAEMYTNAARVARAMIDRIVHHADVLTLKGNSYRLRHTDIDTLPSHRRENGTITSTTVAYFSTSARGQVSESVDKLTPFTAVVLRQQVEPRHARPGSTLSVGS